MKFNSLTISLLLFLLFSCSKNETIEKENKKIEIYLTNKRILNPNSIVATKSDSLIKYIKQNVPEKDFDFFMSRYESKEWDTIQNKFSHKSKFLATKIDLDKIPIVYDSEIGKFNVQKGELKISKSGLDRIAQNIDKKYIWDGQQYVITYGGKPIFSGYFVSSLSSSLVNWYSTYHFHSDLSKGDFKLTTPFKIDQCYCSLKDRESIPNLKSNIKLIKAFRQTGRLTQ